MKKYVELMKIVWKDSLVYRFNTVSDAIFSVVKIIVALLLWSIIFKDKDQVAGYSFSMMITYYIITNFLAKIDQSEECAGTLMGEIRNGQFIKYIIKPVNPFYYFTSQCISKSIYRFIFNLMATLVWICFLWRYFTIQSSLSVFMWAAFIYILGLFFLIQFNYFFSITAFWLIEASSLLYLKRGIVEFLTGALIPLNFFGANVISIFSAFPFYYIYYFPTSLLLNQNVGKIDQAIIILLIWNLIIYITNSLLYKKAVKSFTGVGI